MLIFEAVGEPGRSRFGGPCVSKGGSGAGRSKSGRGEDRRLALSGPPPRVDAAAREAEVSGGVEGKMKVQDPIHLLRMEHDATLAQLDRMELAVADLNGARRAQ